MASSTLASRTLIGSSNIYRFYNPETFSDHHPYLLTRCTRSSTLESNLLEVEAGSIVLISVLENFIQDAVVDSGVTESDAVADVSTGKVVQDAIQKALVTINEAALRTIETATGSLLSSQSTGSNPIGTPSILTTQLRSLKINLKPCVLHQMSGGSMPAHWLNKSSSEMECT